MKPIKTKFLLVIGVWLTILVLIYFASLSRKAARGVDDAVGLVYLVLIGGGSIYKLSQWWRYRSDPEKRDAVAFSPRSLPARWRKFYMDEQDDEAKKR